MPGTGGLQRLVSGGQTGVDRAALDVALSRGIPCDGWCPRGRLAEDGPIATHYPLRETPSSAYRERTAWNVRDSDATLVLTRGVPSGGTALTIRLARARARPLYLVDLAERPAAAAAAAWLERRPIGVLNVAGPRESQQPGIHDEALAFLNQLLDLYSTATRALDESRRALTPR